MPVYLVCTSIYWNKLKVNSLVNNMFIKCKSPSGFLFTGL